MGFWSERQIEEGELHLSFGAGGYVCDECVSDEALKEFVRDHAEATECSFCDRSADEPIAADTDDVLRHISAALQRYYAVPEEVLYFDDESESGFAGPEPDWVEDLISEDEIGCSAFAEFVYKAFDDSRWVSREPYVQTEHEALTFSWAEFSDTIKHQTRFLFALSSPPDDPYPDPGAPVRRGKAFLDEIGSLVREFELVRDLGPGVPLYRVRVCNSDERLSSAKHIGAPPADHAMQNRMSPAGIPMAYCALEPETAIAETLECPAEAGRVVWTGEFQVGEPTPIVDLGRLPAVPSFFDLSESVARREKLAFLHEFHDDISKPIERDDRIHVEYVPTQVITEYLRRAFQTSRGGPVFGLQFASSRNPDGHNVVIFVDRDQCVDPGDDPPDPPALELQNLSSRPATEVCAEMETQLG